MAVRDNKGRFMKRVKQALSNSTPSTFTQEEIAGFKAFEVSVNVVPNKQSVRQSTRRSTIMSAQITVIGNLTADPELRQTNSGKSVINFSLAYTPRKPDGTDGQTSFYNITAWEYLADNFAASFKKGDRLLVIGRVSQDKWQDKESEKTMSRLVITAEEVAGSCRFHTVEMSKVQARKAAETSEETVSEDADIFA